MTYFKFKIFQQAYPLAVLASFLFCSSVSAGGSEDFVKNLSGCFNVTFRYVEDGKNDQTIDDLHEWIEPLKDSPGSLQHIGIAGGQAFKHWREEWSQLSNGNWNQKVIGPFEDFRYECAAPIISNQWRCAVKAAPKPRRDKDRTDYVKLDRENTLQVTYKGWVQSENNTKLDKEGKPVSNELGWNEYRRVDDSNCQLAKDFINSPEFSTH